MQNIKLKGNSGIIFMLIMIISLLPFAAFGITEGASVEILGITVKTADGLADADIIKVGTSYQVQISVKSAGTDEILPTVTLFEVRDGKDDQNIGIASPSSALTQESPGPVILTYSWTPSEVGSASLKAVAAAELEGVSTQFDIKELLLTVQEAEALTPTHLFTVDATGKLTKVTNADGTTASGDVVIPSLVDGVEIITLGNALFSGNADVTSVTIPNTVTTIQNGNNTFGTFKATANLQNVIFESDSKLTNIGSYAFQSSGLKNITLPDSITVIGGNVFQKSMIENVDWPSGLKSIALYAFEQSAISGDLILPEGLETIGGYCFKNCPNLTSVTLPNTMKSGDRQWFYGCSGIESATIKGNGSFTLPDSAFYGCTNLKSVIIESGVKILGGKCFNNCSSLFTVTISADLTEIWDQAFSGCSTLGRIELPKTVTLVKKGAFNNCTSLCKVIKEYNGIDTVAFVGEVFTNVPSVVLYIDENETVAAEYAEGYNNITTAPVSSYVDTIPQPIVEGITGVATPAGNSGVPGALFFRADIGLWFNDEDGDKLTFTILSAKDSNNKDVSWDISIFGSTLTYMPRQAQAGQELTVTLRAFDAVNYSSPVTLVISVQSIPEDSTESFIIDNEGKLLSYLGTATEVQIPETVNGLTVKTLSNELFSGNTEITSVIIPDTVTIIQDGTGGSTNSGAFFGCIGLANVTLSNSLTNIGDYTFSGCTNLSSISLPETLIKIGSNVFEKSGLLAISIPEGVTELKSYTFRNCSSLMEVSLPSDLKSLGTQCFNDCIMLSDITLPDSISSMGSYVFRNCTNLTNIIIPKSLTSIGTSAFNGCSSLSTVELHSNVQEIGDNAFFNCIALTNIDLNEGITSLGGNVFNGCEALKDIIVPASVTRIGSNGFRFCGALESVIVKNVDAKFVGSTVFRDSPNVTLYAAEGSTAEAYAIQNKVNFKPTIVGVQISVQEGSDLTFFNNSVKSAAGKAGEYELHYSDGITFTDITILDALIATHEAKYGTEFVMGNELVIDDKGNVTKAFNKNVSSFGFSVNGAKDLGPIGGTTITSKDIVHFYFGDGLVFASFYQNDEQLGAVTMLKNRQYQFKIKAESGTPLSDIGIYNLHTPAETLDALFPETAIATTDREGLFSISFSEVGSHILAIKSNDGSIVFGYLRVNVIPADNRISSMTLSGYPEFDRSALLKSGYYAGDVYKTGSRKDAGFNLDYETYLTYINPVTTQVLFTLDINDAQYQPGVKLTVTANNAAVANYTNVLANAETNQWIDIPINISANKTNVVFTASFVDGSGTYSKTYNVQIIKSPLDSIGSIEGSGTASDPYLVDSIDRFIEMRNLVNAGNSFEGQYFKMTANITLPADWVPIGNVVGASINLNSSVMGKYMQPFSGVFDGGGYTIIIPSDEIGPFGFVREAVIKNLSIYGEKIAGYGLVNYLCIDYGPDGNSNTGDEPAFIVKIDGVTLKSGSSTLKSGFIGGVSSGINQVFIKNSTIEENVIIGYNKDEKSIGSFNSAPNGTIDNCVSYADVYGVSYVGGIAGIKGQTMGVCAISNCAFLGNVYATGSSVGGILGSGYSSPTAPNSPCVTIKNCYVTGSVTGSDMVGGILGAEGAVQCWENGAGYIQNNHFSGTVTATSGAYSGGIVGYLTGLNRYNLISNNYFIDGCGALGIGYVNYIDTSFENPTTNSSVGRYYNTAERNPGINGVAKLNHNRTDDPMGADGDSLAKMVTAEQMQDGTVTALLNSGENNSGTWKQGESYPVFGEESSEANVVIAQASVVSGGTVLVPIQVNNAEGLAGGEFTLIFDPQVAIPTQVQLGEFLNNFTLEYNLNDAAEGRIRIAFAGDTGVRGNGVLCLVTFQATGAVGSSTQLDINGLKLNDEDAKLISSAKEAGEIEVISSVIFGDINGDQEVTAADATIVLRHVVGLNTLDQNQKLAADVNGDGKITAGDATLILRHIVGLINQLPVK